MLRLSKNCLFEEDFKRHKRGHGVLKRRHPEEIIDKEMFEVKFDFSWKIKHKEKK